MKSPPCLRTIAFRSRVIACALPFISLDILLLTAQYHRCKIQQHAPLQGHWHASLSRFHFFVTSTLLSGLSQSPLPLTQSSASGVLSKSFAWMCSPKSPRSTTMHSGSGPCPRRSSPWRWRVAASHWGIRRAAALPRWRRIKSKVRPRRLGKEVRCNVMTQRNATR